MRLAEIYEVLNEPRKALDLVYQGKSSFPKREALSQLHQLSTVGVVNRERL